MNFKNYIFNIKDEKILKVLKKPIPKKIVSSFEGKSLSAADIADFISFPKEKIYYHIKKLVALEILYISERKEIKGILQKKYKLKSFSNEIDLEKNDNYPTQNIIESDLNTQDTIYQNDQIESSSSRLKYYIAVAGHFLGRGSSNELKIESFKLNVKRKKLNSSIAKIKFKLKNLVEKIDVTIVQISLYDDIELLQNKQKEKIIENENSAKLISKNNKYILTIKEKISFIVKNYNDEKNKKKSLIHQIIKTINLNEKDLLIQSKKLDQIESYMSNTFGQNEIIKKFQKFDFKNDLSELKIQKRKFKKEILTMQLDIELVDSRIKKNEKAIELLVHVNMMENQELVNKQDDYKLLIPISEKVKKNNFMFKSNLENELLNLKSEKNSSGSELTSITQKLNSSNNRKSVLKKVLEPLSHGLIKNKIKHQKLSKKQITFFSDLDNARKQKIALQSSLSLDEEDKKLLLIGVSREIDKIKSSDSIKKYEEYVISKNNMKIDIENLELKIKTIDEQNYQDTEFFEKAENILSKEKIKQSKIINSCNQKVKDEEQNVLLLIDETESYKHLLVLHGTLLRSLKLFEGDLFQLDFDNSVLEKNNKDSSFEITLDRYIKTFNWSINDLKTITKKFLIDDIQSTSGVRDNKKKQIFKEAEKILEAASVMLEIPEKLMNLKSDLNSMRLDNKEIERLKNDFRLQKNQITNKREKRLYLKKIIKTYEEELNDSDGTLNKLENNEIGFNQKIETDFKKVEITKKKIESIAFKETEADFKYNRNKKDLTAKISDSELILFNLKESLELLKKIEKEKKEKIKFFEKYVTLIERESEKQKSLLHSIQITRLQLKSILEQNNKSVEDLKRTIEEDENEIINKKTWISSSRFQEKQILNEIRDWEKEINRLSMEKSLIILEIDKEKNRVREEELKVDYYKDNVVEKIKRELNKESENENSRQKKADHIYQRDRNEQNKLEKKILRVLKIEEKNILDINKRLNKIDQKIQKFTFLNNTKIKQLDRKIESSLSLKDKVNSKIIFENQKLQTASLDKNELEDIMKDKILGTGLKIQKLENKIKFKSSEEYYLLFDQTINVKDGIEANSRQINELINYSILKDKKKIISIRQGLSVYRKEHSSMLEKQKKFIIAIKNKISSLKKQKSEDTLEFKIINRSYNKLTTPLNKLKEEHQQVLKEKDILEKSFIQNQFNEQKKLDKIVKTRNHIDSNYQINLKIFEKIFNSKMNEFSKRIKAQEDIRILKINQSSNSLDNILEKTGKRLNQIEQLIYAGEDVLKESHINLDHILKRREDYSINIKINDQKIYVLDQKIEAIKVKLDSKTLSLNKKIESFKSRIDKSNIKKFEAEDKKDVIELNIKSYDTTIFNFGKNHSQILYDLNQNENLIDQLNKEKNKAKSDFVLMKNKTAQNKKNLEEDLMKNENILKNVREKEIILKNEISELRRLTKVIENQYLVSKDDLTSTNQILLENQKSFEKCESDLRSKDNKYQRLFKHNKKVLKALSNDYQYISSYSKEIKDNEKLINDYVNVVIQDRNETLEVLEVLKIKLRKLMKEIETLEKEIDLNKRNYEGSLKLTNNKKSVLKNDKNNIFEKLKLIKNEIFDLKVIRKSEAHQLNIYSERKKNLTTQLDKIRSSFDQEISAYSKIIKSKEDDLTKVETTLKRCDQRIESLKTSTVPRSLELEKINDSIINFQSRHSDLKIENKSLDSKIEECEKGLRKLVKVIKSDNNSIEKEGKKSDDTITNLKQSLDQNIKSTKMQRTDLEKNIRFRFKLNEELNESIDELRSTNENISDVKNKLNSAKDLKKLLFEQKTLDQIISTLTLKVEQSNEDFKSLNHVINELKENKNQKLKPLEKEIIEREFKLLKSKDVIRQNNQLVNEYGERIKKAPNKIKNLNNVYLEQSRLKFQLELQLKDCLRNADLLNKRATIFNSSNL